MKTKLNKKILFFMLACMMALGTILPAMTAYAAGTAEIGTPGGLTPDPNGSKTIPGNQLYFGTYNNQPILWRVLENKRGKALLFSENNLASMPFKAKINQWKESGIREYLNDPINGLLGKFPEEIRNNMRDVPTAGLDTDKLYLLSGDEAKALNKTELTFSDRWWLRSSSVVNAADCAGTVLANGGLDNWTGDRVDSSYLIRPAFQIPLSSAIFTSSGDGTDGSPWVVGGDEERQLTFGSYIQFQVDGSDKKWKVIVADETKATATLLCADDFGKRAFNENGNVWGLSDVRSFLNPENGLYQENTFTFGQGEWEAISQETVTEKGRTTADRMFLPSLSQMQNTEYFTNTNTARASSTDYWLRSPVLGGTVENVNAVSVRQIGFIATGGERVYEKNSGVRPALNLNLAPVLFPSAAEGGKASATVGSGLVSVVEPTGAVKLTVADSSMTTPTLVLEETTNGTNAIGFSYSGVQIGQNRYISCVLEDNIGKVKYYGKLADCTSNTSGNLTVPLAGVGKSETYTLKIFSELANGDKLTDYIGTPVSITVTVDASGNGVVSNFSGIAKVTVNKDGESWLSDAPIITIGRTSSEALSSGSTFTSGTYNIYANGVDTGVDIAVSGMAAVTATLNYYTLTLEKGTGIASVSGGGLYLSGTRVRIDATVSPGCIWYKWSDGDTNQARRIPVTEKTTLTASATQNTAASTYKVIFNSNGGSDVAAINVTSGSAIEATAVPADPTREGYTFAGWYKESDWKNVWDFATDKVTANITLYAKWVQYVEEPKTYTVTFNVDGAETDMTVKEGEVVTAPAAPIKDGYIFKGWYTDAIDGTEVTVFNTVMTVYARWTVKETPNPEPTYPETPPTIPIPTPTPTPVPETKVEDGQVTTTIPAKPTTDVNGRAVAPISEKQLEDAIVKAMAEAVKQGSEVETTIKIEVSSTVDAKTSGVSLTDETLKKFAESNVDTLVISTLFGTMTFDDKAAEGIIKQSNGTITITATKGKASELTAELSEKVGDRPVVSFDITDKDKAIVQLSGKVEVTMPYVLKAGENANAILAYNINASGKPETVTNCKYDPAAGMLTFKTKNVSKFAVAYNKVDFANVAKGAWYYDAVTFVAARGITSGTGGGNFGSSDNVTRAQALVMIMKAFGINPDESAENNFGDAGNTYYTGYLAAAKNLGITSGVGDNKFAPDRQVTRQELFVLVYNTLKNMNELPTTSTTKELADFKDAGKVTDYANKAVGLFVKAGIISGTAGNILPEDSASRAQFVQILYNIMTK